MAKIGGDDDDDLALAAAADHLIGLHPVPYSPSRPPCPSPSCAVLSVSGPLRAGSPQASILADAGIIFVNIFVAASCGLSVKLLLPSAYQRARNLGRPRPHEEKERGGRGDQTIPARKGRTAQVLELHVAPYAPRRMTARPNVSRENYRSNCLERSICYMKSAYV